MIWLYPANLRREYQHELLLTFRNRIEDVVNARPPLVGDAVHRPHRLDWLRTFSLEHREPPTLSLLGLGSREATHAAAWTVRRFPFR